MECREPLVTKIEVPATPATDTIAENGVVTPSRYSSSYGRRSVQGRGGYGVNGKAEVPAPKKNYVTRRLPLPKNAVLLSLIQASEPARRRHAEEPENLPPVLPTSPSEEDTAANTAGNSGAAHSDSPKETTTVKFHKPSPLFLDKPASPVSVHYDDHHMGSMLENDDEEHKIRVGTYLEGGPCGTYAVASSTGLLVYPTLLEHTFTEEDGVSRDVETMVKNSYRNKFYKQRKEGTKKSSLPRSASCAGGSSQLMSVAKLEEGSSSNEVITYHECNNSQENLEVEAQFSSKNNETVASQNSLDCSLDETDEESLRGEAMSDPGASSSLPPSPALLSLTRGKRQYMPQSLAVDATSLEDTTSADPALSATLKLRRQFSLGSGNSVGSGDTDFDRSLIRLNYGDRVQVVSMDSRGWVKLARGYGYIRLENDKQLVKGVVTYLYSIL